MGAFRRFDMGWEIVTIDFTTTITFFDSTLHENRIGTLYDGMAAVCLIVHDTGEVCSRDRQVLLKKRFRYASPLLS